MVDLVPKLKDFIVLNNPDFSSLFNARQNIQTLPIYIITHYLDLINLKVVIQDKHQDVFFKWLNTHIPLENQAKIRGAFFAFRMQRDGFHLNNILQKDIDNPAMFWRTYTNQYPDLACLALWIFETIANSIALERAFSAINLNHSKQRNSLNLKKVSMLIYIYINQRTLDLTGDRLQINDENWEKKTEVEKVAMEDKAIETNISNNEDEEDNKDDEEEEEEEDIDMDEDQGFY